MGHGVRDPLDVVDVYVRYLREKIDRPFGCGSLETVRGVGYRLREPGVMLKRIPIRWRLAVAFAVSMAALLVALGPHSSTSASTTPSGGRSTRRCKRSRRKRSPTRKTARCWTPTRDQSGMVAQVVAADGRTRAVGSAVAVRPDLPPETLTLQHGTAMFLTTVSLGRGERNRWRALAVPDGTEVLVVPHARFDRRKRRSAMCFAG